ncbi:zf-HC2 domain-containing protein [Herbiconiux sp. CPCC 205763]|uniref:Zf-HC2 domain-containing protein n=1 Tax=Herbiconiux aconitum TaxID=2970913 RepID=A0ABT2GRM1_9MICO|nr:zf-HC2 domain-containing protein [Herbiconiux aconitum]MCS5718869.1 zf-HC2 domain-containing protein [Herbiconiux aconitum]
MIDRDEPVDPDRADDPYRDWDAAYLFGMLGPEERRVYERHLATCPECAAAVTEHSGLPGILRKLSTAEAGALLYDPPAPVSLPPDSVIMQDLARSVRRTRTRRRRRLTILAGGVGAVLAVGGLFAGCGLIAISEPSAPFAIVSPAPTAPSTADAPGDGVARAMVQVEPGYVDAELAVTQKGWGTRFDWSCSYGAERPEYPGAQSITYDLVVTDAQGTETTVASWSASGEKATNLSASTSIPTSELRSVDIRVAGGDRPLVRTTL